MAKVFLSHSSKDAAVADAVHTSLNDLHHETFLDHDPGDGIEPGADWERTLYERLQWADAVVCIVTQNYIQSLWCSIEVAIAKAQGRRIIPLAAEAGVKHPLLKAVQSLRYGADAADALARLAGHLAAIDAGGGVAWNRTRAVFPGLIAFDTDDRAVFFGRDGEIRDVLKEIRARVGQRQPRALIVVGASGSGKSSLVRAGVIPNLLDDEAWWRLQPIMPGDAPFVALADAIARGRKEVKLAPDFDRVMTQLRADGLAAMAREILLQAPGDRQRLLITIDQMEELFTRGNDSDRSAFLTMLAKGAGESDGPVAVVATMRSEFLGELLHAPEGRLLRERPFLLAPMDAEHLEDVITKPAQKAQIEFDGSLVRRLVDDTGSGEALPLLAFTLARLVDGIGPGGRVDLARYQAIGGVKRSVEIQAEAALSKAQTDASCTDAEAVDALMVFVTLDEAGRPARRRRRRDELPPARLAIVSAFEQARLLTTDTDDGVEFVSVAHETLFTAWNRMAQAISAAAATLKLRRDVEHAFAEWHQAGRKPDLLWRGERLELARRLLANEIDFGPDEKTFIEESARVAREQAERESEMLADRIESRGMLEGDPELALLYLLAAADEYAVTPAVVGGMRRALAAQRMVGRVGPVEHQILQAMVSDDGELIAIADLGTNQRIRPSTRAQPKPPVGDVQLTVWRLEDRKQLGTVALHGRDVLALEWSRDRRLLAIAVDSRVDVLNADTLAVTSSIDVGRPRLPIDRRRLEIAPDNRRIEIDSGPESHAFVRSPDDLGWINVPAPLPGDELPAGNRVLPAHPVRTSHLVACPHAGRLLDIIGTEVEIWGVEGADHAEPASVAESDGAIWMRGPAAGDELLAVSADGRWRCLNRPPRLVDEQAHTELPLPWSFVIAAGFSGDGHRLALVTRLEIGVIDTATDQVIATMGGHSDEEGDTYSAVALNHDGSVLVSGSLGGGRSHVWDVATGQSQRHAGGRWVGISGDGRYVAASGKSELTVHLDDGTPLEVDTQSASSFLFDQANRSLLAVRGTVREYSLPDGNTAADYPAELDAVGFAADGRHVLGRRGGVTLRWPDRGSDAVIARARKAVFRSLTQGERDNFELHGASRHG